MSKRGPVLIIIAALVLLGAVIVLILKGTGSRGFNWTHSYAVQSKQPYGTSAFHTLMKGYFPEQAFHHRKENPMHWLPEAGIDTPALYVFIGTNFYLSDSSISAMEDFLDRGNQALVLTDAVQNDWLSALEPQFCDLAMISDFNWVSVPNMNFIQENLRADSGYAFAHRYRGDTTRFYWTGFDYVGDTCSEGDTYFPLGTLSDTMMNFFAFHRGEGTMFVHSTSLVFTNLYLSTGAGKEYTEKVLGYLSPADIYWDSFSDLDISATNKQNSSATPMEFILSQKPLRWAWYLLLAAVLLYVALHSKRMQRIVPVVLPPGHTAMEFAQAVGELYFRHNDHFSAVQKQMGHWRQFLWRQYRIHPEKAVPEQADHIAQRTGAPVKLVNEIFDRHTLMNRFTGAKAKELLAFYQSLQAFYKTVSNG